MKNTLITLYWFLIGILSVPLLILSITIVALVFASTILGGIISILKERIDRLRFDYFESKIIKKD